jgi:hypothetical protein
VAFATQIIGTRVTITPTAPLPLGARLFATVQTPLHSTAGAALAEPFTLAFRTATSSNTAPQLYALTPGQGPVEGGTAVSVSGSGFVPGARLFFGTQEAAALRVVSPTLIEATTPPNLEGPSFVTLLNPDGLEDSVVGGFVYVPILDVGFVRPATGRLAGGTAVIVGGSGFQRGAVVRFDGVEATEVLVTATGTLRAMTPPSVRLTSRSRTPTAGSAGSKVATSIRTCRSPAPSRSTRPRWTAPSARSGSWPAPR